MIYICNAFSLGMLDDWRMTDVDSCTSIDIQPVANPIEWLEEAESRHGEATSAVDCVDTAIVFSTLLERPVAFSSMSLKISESDELLVGQINGPILIAGSTTLPEGTRITWIAVTLK